MCLQGYLSPHQLLGLTNKHGGGSGSGSATGGGAGVDAPGVQAAASSSSPAHPSSQPQDAQVAQAGLPQGVGGGGVAAPVFAVDPLDPHPSPYASTLRGVASLLPGLSQVCGGRGRDGGREQGREGGGMVGFEKRRT